MSQSGNGLIKLHRGIQPAELFTFRATVRAAFLTCLAADVE
jgi:hypothetical protein